MSKNIVKISESELMSIIAEAISEQELDKDTLTRGQMYAGHDENKFRRYGQGNAQNKVVQGIYGFFKVDLSGVLDYADSANDMVQIIDALKRQIRVMKMAEANLYNRITGKQPAQRAPRKQGGMRAPRRKFDWSALGDTGRRYGYRDPDVAPADYGTNNTGSYLPQRGNKFQSGVRQGMYGQGSRRQQTTLPGWSGSNSTGFVGGRLEEGMFSSDPVPQYMKTYRKITDPDEMNKAYDAIASRILQYQELVRQLEARLSKWEGNNTIYDLNKGNRDAVARAKEFRRKFRMLSQDQIISLVKNNVPCDWKSVHDFLFGGGQEQGRQIAESVDRVVRNAIKRILG